MDDTHILSELHVVPCRISSFSCSFYTPSLRVTPSNLLRRECNSVFVGDQIYWIHIIQSRVLNTIIYIVALVQINYNVIPASEYNTELMYHLPVHRSFRCHNLGNTKSNVNFKTRRQYERLFSHQWNVSIMLYQN